MKPKKTKRPEIKRQKRQLLEVSRWISSFRRLLKLNNYLRTEKNHCKTTAVKMKSRRRKPQTFRLTGTQCSRRCTEENQDQEESDPEEVQLNEETFDVVINLKTEIIKILRSTQTGFKSSIISKVGELIKITSKQQTQISKIEGRLEGSRSIVVPEISNQRNEEETTRRDQPEKKKQ